MNNRLKYILLIFFGISLYLIPLSNLLGYKTLDEKEFLAIERRQMARLMPWSIKDMKGYFINLEKHVNDRFAFRHDLLNIFARMKVYLGQSPDPDQVVSGSDNWLFYNSKGLKLMRQFQGREPLTRKEIIIWRNYFLSIQKYLNKKNIEFILAIAPDKHSIYPEYLPYYYSHKGITPFDQILKESGDLNIIDLHQRLISYKSKTDKLLYYKTDTHWNVFGAYHAYVELSSAIRWPYYQKLMISDSCFNYVNEWYNSDLLGMIRLTKQYSDHVYSVSGSCLGTDSIYQCSDLSFTDGKIIPNNQMIGITGSHFINNPAKPGRALIIGDSFMVGMSPYFNNSFGSICYKHLLSRQKEDLLDIVNEVNPDIVIWEMVERYLKLPVNNYYNWLKRDVLELFYSYNMAELVNTSIFNKFIKNVSYSQGGLRFSSFGADPIIILPEVDLPTDPFVVEVDLSSNVSGIAEIFYQTEGNKNYSEKNRVNLPLKAGRQLLRFRLDEIDVIGKLRFDPCAKEGVFTLYSITIYSFDSHEATK